jgi:hypothetical protein
MTDWDPNYILEGTGVRLSEIQRTHPITPQELQRAGEVILSAIGVCVAMGHNSPNGMMEYAKRPSDADDPIAAVIWDAFAATRIGDEWAVNRDNLIRFAWQRGLMDAIAEAVTH